MNGDPVREALRLLPCPFCGHDSPEFERMGTRRQSCIVACGNCGCRHESSDEGADCGKSWNTRAAPAAPQPHVAGLPVAVDPSLPAGALYFVQDGRVIGRVVEIDAAKAPTP